MSEQVDYSENPSPKFPPPDRPAPSRKELQMTQLLRQQAGEWTTITTGASVDSSSLSVRSPVGDSTNRLLSELMQLQSNKNDAIADDQSSASSRAMRTPDRKTKRLETNAEEQKKARAATTLQLSQLLHQVTNRGEDTGASASAGIPPEDEAPTFPWWEVGTEAVRGEHVDSSSFHARTCVGGRIGILIDPGAHDNLTGEETIRMLEMQINTRAKPRILSSPLHVSGVGKHSQTADRALTIDFGLPTSANGNTGVPWKCSYTAPVIAGSSLPLLLGLKSLMAKKALLDTHGKLLIIPGPGGVEIRCSPGTVALQLEMSDSGHLILPVRPQDREVASNSDAERVDFNVQCRAARTPSPVRNRPEPVAGPFQRSRSENVVRTGRPVDPHVPSTATATWSLRSVPRRDASRSRDYPDVSYG